ATLGRPIQTRFPYTTLFRSSAALSAETTTAPESTCRKLCTAGASPFCRLAETTSIGWLKARALRIAGRLEAASTGAIARRTRQRSEEHTSELQSREKLVCRL